MGDLNIGHTLDVAGDLLRDNFWNVIRINLYLFMPFYFLINLIVIWIAPENTFYGAMQNIIDISENPELAMLTKEDAWTKVLVFTFLGIYWTVSFVLIVPLTYGALTRLLASSYLGIQTNARECFRWAWRNYGRIFVTILFFWLIIVAAGFAAVAVMGVLFALGSQSSGDIRLIAQICGFLLLIAALLGVLYLYYRYCIYLTAMVVENEIYGAALRRSAFLTRGRISRAFWLSVFSGIICLLVLVAGEVIPIGWLSLALVTGITAVTQTFQLTVMIVYYFNCRCKHEFFDAAWLARRAFPLEAPVSAGANNGVESPHA